MTLDHAAPPAELTEASPSSGQRFTFTDAARVTRTSRSTIKRRHAALAFPNAVKDRDGAWLIPLGDLLAAGLVPSDRPGPLPPVVDQAQPDATQGPDLARRVVELETALAVERVRREAAERLATERLDRVDDLRRALRALEPARVPAQLTAEPPPRHWWPWSR